MLILSSKPIRRRLLLAVAAIGLVGMALHTGPCFAATRAGTASEQAALVA